MLDYPLVHTHADIARVTDILLAEAGLDRADQGGTLTFSGLDPVAPTPVKAGAASAAVIAANAVATAILWRARRGEGQDIHVDLAKSHVVHNPWQDGATRYTTMNGLQQLPAGPSGGLEPLLLPTRDDRRVILAAFDDLHAVRACKLLNCPILPEQLGSAIRTWESAELEKAAQEAGVPLTICRTSAEYRASEQYAIHRATPLIAIERIAEGPALPLPEGPRPLSGLRVLGMTHSIAGPTVLRQLSAQGADCLNLNRAGWAERSAVYWQSHAGIRQTFLDARIEANQPIYELARGADVFVQNLRPHRADREGFSADTLARHRPGIIHVELRLNAPAGPWADWMGFDFNAAGLAGLLCDIGSADEPRLPSGTQVVCAFLTAYLAAIGVQAALLRRAREGGSYRVSVNLAQTVMLEQALGFVSAEALDQHAARRARPPVVPCVQRGRTAFGEFTRLGSQVEMSRTPEFWADPIISPIGSGSPIWLDPA
ncbi:CoA transferase [Sphingopyxis sp. LARHCG72]